MERVGYGEIVPKWSTVEQSGRLFVDCEENESINENSERTIYRDGERQSSLSDLCCAIELISSRKQLECDGVRVRSC